jgi:CheY-like chemotaxis protein
LLTFRFAQTKDNMINSRVIQRQLKKAGMTCETAFDGQQGLDAVVRSYEDGQRRFNCVLVSHPVSALCSSAPDLLAERLGAAQMDCEMPVMSGPQAVKEIRRLEAAGTLPSRSTIFALTGNARQGQIDDAMEAGMDDVIIKPYRIDQLLVRSASAHVSRKGDSKADDRRPALQEKLRTQSKVV